MLNFAKFELLESYVSSSRIFLVTITIANREFFR